MVFRVLTSVILLCGILAVTIALAWAGKVKITALTTPDSQIIAWFGWTIKPIGDLDGDGVVDLAVSAPQQEFTKGAVMVFSGRDSALLFTIQSPVPELGANFGEAIRSIGDVNGDSISDLVVGARLQDVGGNEDQGQAYVFSGVNGTWLGVTLVAPVSQTRAFFGASVGTFGGRSQNGSSVIIVGAPQQSFGDIEQEGAVFLMSATNGELLSIVPHPDPQAGASFGFVVESVGDLDGDSVGDFVVTSPFQDVAGNTAQGQVYVFSGQSTELLYTLNTPKPMPSARFGFSVTGTSDLNGDGVSDLVVGAPTSDDPVRNQGRAFVFSGADGMLLHTLDDPTPLESGFFGGAVASPGDLDGDGIADIAVGAPAPVSDSQGTIHPGEVILFSGASGEHLLTLDDPSPGTGASFGFSLSAAGDVDGDGIPDLLAGAPFHEVTVDGEAKEAQGEAFVISGLAPDLKGKNLEVFRTVGASGRDRLEFVFKVKNRGTVKTATRFKVKAHLSNDDIFDGGKVDPRIAKWTVVESLLPRDSVTLTGAAEFAESVSGKFLIIRVDSNNDIVESREGNNIKKRAIQE